MMNSYARGLARLVVGACSLQLLVLLGPVLAEEHGESPAEPPLVGEINISGENFSMNFDGATINLSFNDAAESSPSSTDSDQQVERLLFLGLESLVLSDEDQPQTELFSEAFRLSPENPNVAFWYAKVLVDSGDGKMAQQVFEPRRESIAIAYPRMVNDLARQITQRLELETLPHKLVDRIDQFQKSIRLSTSLQNESDSYGTYFRLVDQDDQPIDESVFRMQCNGQDENLESFEQGYYFFTFQRRRSYDNSPCKVEVSDVQMANDTFEFTSSRNAVKNAGVFRVRRYRKSDQSKVQVVVKNKKGEPLDNVQLQFRPQRSYRSSSSPATARTDRKGRASRMLFPGDYYCATTAKGYLSASVRFQVPDDGSASELVQITLDPLIPASAIVSWHAKQLQHRGGTFGTAVEATSGELRLDTKQTTNHSNIFALRQTKNKVQLQFSQPYMGHPYTSMMKDWIGTYQTGPDDPATAFKAIKLDQLDKGDEGIKDITPTPLRSSGRGMAIDVEQGSVYVGEFLGRDPQRGQPALITFKVWIEKIGRPAQ